MYKIFKIKIFMIILFLFHSFFFINSLTFHSITKFAIEDLEKAYIWVIEHGLEHYYQYNYEGIPKKPIDHTTINLGKFYRDHDKLRNDIKEITNVTVYSWPSIEEDGYIFDIRLVSSNVRYTVTCFKREYFEDLFEYWVVFINSGASENVKRNCYFIITKAKDLKSRREIIIKEDQFIEKYKIADNKYFEFPIDDLSKLIYLEAWYYPNNFKESSLKNYKIDYNKYTKKYKNVKLSDSEKKKYQDKANKGWSIEDILSGKTRVSE